MTRYYRNLGLTSVTDVQARDVDCPRCGAHVGDPCVHHETPTRPAHLAGYRRRRQGTPTRRPHTERRRAAVDPIIHRTHRDAYDRLRTWFREHHQLLTVVAPEELMWDD